MNDRLAVRKTYKLYVGGAFPRSESGRSYEVTDAKGHFLANAAWASRKDARDAVKAAAMLEDVARTVHLSRQLGEPLPIDPAHVDSLFDRYQNVYGQQPAAVPTTPGALTRESSAHRP